MKKLLAHAVLLCCSAGIFAQNLPPVLSNVTTALSSTNVMTITYDLADAEGDAVTVGLRATAASGQVFDYNTANATGAVGAGIAPGNGKQISWDFSAYAANQAEFRLLLVADDGQAVDIQSLVDQVDSTRLFGDLTFLEGIRHRSTGAAHLQEAKDLIWFQFLDNELETYDQPFTYGNYAAQNLIGRLIGTTDEQQTYILGGHFDTVSDSPGADDNGSAVAGMLEAMRILSKYSFKKTIKFIGFDLEEDGLLGSKKYVQSGTPAGETVKGMIDFEMIGYYTEQPNTQVFPSGFEIIFPDAYNEVAAEEFKGNFITNVGKQGSGSSLMTAYHDAAANYVPALRVIDVLAPSTWQSLTPDLGRSDHAPFWVANTPAIMLTDGANYRNDNYHESSDTLGTLNFTFMNNVVKGAVATLAELAEIQHADTWWGETQLFTPTHEPDGCTFALSPNPASQFLSLQWGDACSPGLVSVELADLSGKLLRSLRADPSQSANRLPFDLRGLPKGVYLLQVSGAKATRVEKLVVE